MVIDVHAHLWMGHVEQNKAEILAAMERYGISKVFVSGLGAHVPTPDEVMQQNRAVYDFTREEPDRIYGYVYVSPEHSDAVNVLRHGVEDMGMKGMKLWVSTFCDVPEVNPLAERCIEYGIPVLIHAFVKATGQYPNESTALHVAHLARRYPELKIIMAHLGGNSYDAIPQIAKYQNVWVDDSGSIYQADELPYTLAALGAGRVLHGTDMPGTYLGSYGQALAIEDPEARTRILWKNAMQLFDTNFKIGEPYHDY